MPCPGCGKPHNRSVNGPCAACYRRAYYKTAKGKEAVDRANKKDITKHPERRFAAVVRYRDKIGYYIPTELHQLYAAVKRLDATVEAADKRSGVREPSQRRCIQSIERRDRFGDSTNILRAGTRGGAGAVERGDALALPEDRPGHELRFGQRPLGGIMRPDEIKIGHTYYNGVTYRMVIGIHSPVLGIQSDALVEYRVRGEARVLTTGLTQFARWATRRGFRK
jgi:hypothetical protein